MADDDPCTLCGGEMMLLGALGNRVHSKCRACGMERSVEPHAVVQETPHAHRQVPAYIAQHAGTHIVLGVGPDRYRIYDARHLEVGESIERLSGSYVLLIVSEPILPEPRHTIVVRE